MAHHPLTARSKVLGLPMGPRQPDWSSIFGAVLAGALVVGIAQAGLVAKRTIKEGKQRLAEPLHEGKELVHETEDLVHEGEKLMDQAGALSNSVSG